MPHNRPFLPHNFPWKCRRISHFLPHPIRSPVKRSFIKNSKEKVYKRNFTCFVCGFVLRFLKLLFYTKQLCFALQQINSRPFFLRLSILSAFLAILEVQIFKIFRGSMLQHPLGTSCLWRSGYCPPPQSKTYSACPSDACNVRSIKPTWVLYSHDCVFSYENVLFFSKVSCIFLLLPPKKTPNICSGGIIWWSIIPDTFKTKITLLRQGFCVYTQLSGPVLAGGASMG